MAAQRLKVRPFVAAFVCAASSFAAAQAPPLIAPTAEPIAGVAGAWEISAAAETRKCRLLLNQRATQDKRMILGVAPPCRIAMPALVGAAGWGLGEDGRIHLFKQDGALLMTFRREIDGAFKGDGFADLTMTPIGGRITDAPRSETVAATMQALTGATPARDAERAALTGAYMLSRSRDGSDCALELRRLPGPRARRGGAVWTAGLDADCKDEGLRTFDPVGWQFENGRIFLVAKRGHAIGFTRERAGDWAKDPVAGRPLWLRKQ